MKSASADAINVARFATAAIGLCPATLPSAAFAPKNVAPFGNLSACLDRIIPAGMVERPTLPIPTSGRMSLEDPFANGMATNVLSAIPTNIYPFTISTMTSPTVPLLTSLPSAIPATSKPTIAAPFGNAATSNVTSIYSNSNCAHTNVPSLFTFKIRAEMLTQSAPTPFLAIVGSSKVNVSIQGCRQ